MITLDESIAEEKEEAKRLRKIIETGYDGEISIELIFCDDTDAIKEAYERFENCAKRHEQLAEWLEELKTYMALKKSNFLSGYDKAIDDFAELLREKRDKRTMKVGCDDLELRKIKEQLKAGGEE